MITRRSRRGLSQRLTSRKSKMMMKMKTNLKKRINLLKKIKKKNQLRNKKKRINLFWKRRRQKGQLCRRLKYNHRRIRRASQLHLN